MPSLKRRISAMKIKLIRKQRKSEEKEIERYQKQRNAALRQAKKSTKIAQAREDAKDAAMASSQAKARLNATKNLKGKALLASLKKSGGALAKDLKGFYEGKPNRRTKQKASPVASSTSSTYYCYKCKENHRKSSKIGKEHKRG